MRCACACTLHVPLFMLSVSAPLQILVSFTSERFDNAALLYVMVKQVLSKRRNFL